MRRERGNWAPLFNFEDALTSVFYPLVYEVIRPRKGFLIRKSDMSLIQYIKDTQGELRHVAWPTRLQTVVYTILVALLSVLVALYLGLFDYIFTGGLARLLEVLPAAPIEITQDPTSTTSPIILDSVDTTSVPAAPKGLLEEIPQL